MDNRYKQSQCGLCYEKTEPSRREKGREEYRVKEEEQDGGERKGSYKTTTTEKLSTDRKISLLERQEVGSNLRTKGIVSGK